MLKYFIKKIFYLPFRIVFNLYKTPYCNPKLKYLGHKVELDHVFLLNTEKIQIDDFTYIGRFCSLSGSGGLKIGKNCQLAPHVVIHSGGHNFRKPSLIPVDFDVDPVKAGVIIEDHCWIGDSAIILPGVVVGELSIVAAGSVVTKNVRAFSIVAGNPAKEIRMRDKDYLNTLKKNGSWHKIVLHEINFESYIKASRTELK